MIEPLQCDAMGTLMGYRVWDREQWQGSERMRGSDGVDDRERDSKQNKWATSETSRPNDHVACDTVPQAPRPPNRPRHLPLHLLPRHPYTHPLY